MTNRACNRKIEQIFLAPKGRFFVLAKKSNVAYIKAFTLYKAANGEYTPMPSGNYCLGGNFPVGYNNERRCWVYDASSQSIPASTNGPLMSALRSVERVSDGERTPVRSNVGPWVTYTTNAGSVVVLVINAFAGTSDDICPSQAPVSYNGGGVVICRASLR